MRAMRQFLGWIFGLIATINILIAGAYLASLAKSVLHPAVPLTATHILRHLIVPAVFSAIAFTFGKAWWTILRDKPSASRWGIAASLLHTAAMASLFFASKWIPQRHTHHLRLVDVWLLVAIGLAGVVVFSLRYKRPDLSGKIQETAPLSGDGTSKFINKTAGFWGFAMSYGLYFWLGRWYRAKGFPVHHTGLHINLVTILLTVLFITFVHELGHSAVGLALGMKLRAFVAGPLQWRVESGKWKFQFNIMAILAGRRRDRHCAAYGRFRAR